MNGDGLQDILIGSYCGAPQLILQTKNGYGEPASIVDKNGDLVIMKTYWNYETEGWIEEDSTGAHEHCTSVASVD